MASSELVTVTIESNPEGGVDFLPDLLRELGAIVRLLTEFSDDPRVSKVEVISLEKKSPTRALLRVVRITDELSKQPGRSQRRAIKPTSQPIRRLERAYSQARSKRKVKHLDATGLSVMLDAANQLKNATAVIDTSRGQLRISQALIAQINSKLEEGYVSRGTLVGVLESINVHAKPWSFTIYPKIGPARVRCHFDESLFGDVQHAIRQVVRVHGLKRFVADDPYPISMKADRIEVLEEAPAGAWLTLIEDLSAAWDDASEDERLIFEMEQGA